jgi:hypothetical protein
MDHTFNGSRNLISLIQIFPNGTLPKGDPHQKWWGFFNYPDSNHNRNNLYLR